jgi:hypothetical protein
MRRRCIVRKLSSQGLESICRVPRWPAGKLGEGVIPIVNLLNEQLLDSPLIQCDETRVQVLSSEKAPTAEHWIWVRGSGPPHRRIILFDYDPSRGGAVPLRLLDGYTGILQT